MNLEKTSPAMLSASFFDRDVLEVARDLVGKVLRRRWQGHWLAAMIVETEAYALREAGSHASLGRTPSREALWAAPGTVYMYYSRGGDSLNVSCRGDGDAVLFKAGAPWTDGMSPPEAVECMHQLNPVRGSGRKRPTHRLCSGQTLLCAALALRVPDWNGRPFDRETFFIEDVGFEPEQLVQAPRLGIPQGRDEALPWRFIDSSRLHQATRNPVTRRGAVQGSDYHLMRLAQPSERGA